MDCRAYSTHLGRLDQTSAVERDRDANLIEVKLNTAADEECAGQKFTKITAAICEVQNDRPDDYQGDDEDGYVHTINLLDKRDQMACKSVLPRGSIDSNKTLQPAAAFAGILGPFFAKPLG
jgi:hypothetical protein